MTHCQDSEEEIYALWLAEMGHPLLSPVPVTNVRESDTSPLPMWETPAR